jgi:hypothetical protein
MKCLECGKELIKKDTESKEYFATKKYCSNECRYKSINFNFHEGHNGYWSGKERPKEENSCRWVGDEIGIKGVHKWIERRKGKPKKCSHCQSISEKIYEWANIGHTYKRKISDWIRLCRKCHRKFDFGREIYEQ